MRSELDNLYDNIIDGEMAQAPIDVQTALDTSIPAGEILNTCMIPAMQEVGQLFEDGEFFVPEMLIAARAMQAGLTILKPHLVASGVDPVGKVVIGTVQGDMHDIGKNLVTMMMEGAGFEVIDLGVDVSPQAFIESVNENQPQVVAMSALLTTTMPKMKVTIDAFREAGVLDSVKVLVGGAPVTAEFAESIGADGYAPDAGQAASLAKSFLA
ncbi:corrinoid protein [Candidatus Leptofilum sp.]|uniref:corrinoid protein n=1 Tax=Candidatus Leptofilum sp. TaxID=3241576 RepID=UPI003B59834B